MMMQYTSIKLPIRLSEMIKESPRYKEYGYTSVSSYVLEATRVHLDRIKKEMKL